MAITYTWKLSTLKKKTHNDIDNVVIQTHWKKIGTDEFGNEGEFSGATPFDPAKLNVGSFTPYEELTQEQVLTWIKAIVVGDYETHVNGKIKDQIDAKKNPVDDVSETQLPWVSGGSVTPPLSGVY